MRKKAANILSPKWSFRIKDTPLGPLLLTFTLEGLAALEFSSASPASSPAPPPPLVAACMDLAPKELSRYFAGHPTDFPSLRLNLQGTPFQLQVWQELRKIPWGATISYQELATRLENPKATRAVGQAVGANPLPLIIPCHRVIRANGKLGGYSSGLDRKRWLLRHEGAMRG